MIVTIASCRISLPETRNLVARWASYEDRTHAARRKQKAAQAASLTARALMRSVLVEVWGQGDFEVEADHGGKPWLRTADGDRGPSISLSHSGDWVAVATAEQGALGIDIESHRPRNFKKLSAYAFGLQEQKVAAEGADAFYRLWVLREARSKATGAGIAEAANGQDQVAGCPELGNWVDPAKGEFWHFAHRRPAIDLSLGVAIKVPADQAVTMRFL
ncbi:4'-phosphopantetheinyl transferase family protein [Lacibacterium aquatile]|uniref:4'-phosphopantetheinyl transferase family protein n=1 Tax=Lacibacterium aquatile TaxID=1168082 RepID=A0ABW5DVZ7_9PROT